MPIPFRKIIPPAVASFRDSVRSRLFASLAAALAIIVVSFLYATPPKAGDAATHNFIFYSLFCCSALLSIAAMAAAAASASGEIRNRTMHLVRVKPIQTATFLVGKWLGLVLSFALLLALALALVSLASRNTQSFRTCNERIPPDLPPIGWQVEQIVGKARASGVSDEAELRRLRSDSMAKLPFATATLAHGETWNFHFNLGSPLAQGTVALQVAFASDSYSPVPLSVSCVLSNPHGPSSPGIPFAVSNLSARLMSIPLESPALEGATELSLSMRHGGSEGTMPVMLQPRQSIAILVPACDSALNFVRAFLVMLPVLALLLAIGLASGSIFSLPVAVFSSCGLLLAVFVAEFAVGDPDSLEIGNPSGKSSPLEIFSQTISVTTVKTLHFIADPAIEPAPVEALSNAELVPSADIASSLLWNGAAIPLAIMLGSAAVLARKELP